MDRLCARFFYFLRHSLSYTSRRLHCTNQQLPFSSGFLFFCAGYLRSNTFSISKRFRQFILPYFLFAIVFYIIWLVTRHYGADAETPLEWWKPLVGILYGTTPKLPQNAPLWFLTALFSFELIFTCKKYS